MEEETNVESMTAAEMLQKVKEAQAELLAFQMKSVQALNELLNTTSVDILESVSTEFYQAVADTGLTLLEVGKEFRSKLNEECEDLLKGIVKDEVVSDERKNLYIAAILNIFVPFEEWTKDEETRKSVLMHMLFVNAALRAAGLRFNGCKEAWKAADDAVQSFKETTNQ